MRASDLKKKTPTKLTSKERAKSGTSVPKAKSGKKMSKGPVSYAQAAKAVGYKSGGKVKKAQNGDEGGLTNKWNYVEGDTGSGANSFGVAKTSNRLFGGGKRTKAVMYDTGFVPGNARILREKTDREGKVVSSSEKPISVKRASRMMRRKGGEYKSGGKMKNGGVLGAKSVKAGVDKNPNITRADIITAAKGKAKGGGKMGKCKGGC